MKDPERKSEVFDAIAELLNDSSLSYEQQLELKKIVLNQVKELASVDGRKVAQLFLDFWPLEHFNVVSRLSSVPRLQLSYLKGVFGQEEVPEVLKRDAMNKSWVNLHDIYFRRLVELDPVSLRPALDRAYTYASGYPFTIVDILKLAKLHHVADAACWILEKTGDLKGALQLFKEEMQRTQDEGTLQSLTHTAILFCDQIKGRLDAKEYQEYWLAIFDAVNSSPQGRDLASQVMDAMTGHIPLPTILLHIVQVQQRASLGDYRDMIDSMLTVNSYEQELYLATNDLVLTEVYNDFDSLVRSRRRAFKPARGFCRGCRKVIHLQAMRYDDRESEIVVMACQHSYHLDCLKKVGMKCKDCNPFSEKAKGKSRAS